MSFRSSVLVSTFLLFAVVVIDGAEGRKNCTIAEHIGQIEQAGWSIDPEKNNIYGNDSVGRSIVFTFEKKRLEGKINEQINRELFAHYTYLSMAAHFGRDDNYLPGFAKFFKESAEEEHKHAMMFIDYQNKRGGRVKLHPIMAPCDDAWGDGLMAMNAALKLERIIYNCLIDLHKVADKDPQMLDFLESNFLNEQIDSINLLGRHIGSLKRLGAGLGEYQFDKLTLGGK